MALPTGKVASPSASTSSLSAKDLALSLQLDAMVGGDGGGERVDCGLGLSKLAGQGETQGQPTAWLMTNHNDPGVSLGDHVTLCLYRYPQTTQITVEVQAGSLVYTTPVTVVPRDQYQTLPRDALFNGSGMNVKDVGSGVLQSDGWKFFPYDQALQGIGLSNGLTLTASGGGVTTKRQVSLLWERGAYLADEEEGPRELFVYGYPIGARVPVGLYRVEHALPQNPKWIGDVVMPSSRIASLAILPELRLGPPQIDRGETVGYCLGIPTVSTCFPTWV
ncbi:hypothetical protein AB0O22_17530 [Streptomyces sp. NPDC091204]|uniref:hypothetical protein n=1 Tax=Streptomyces sp. NPDC091204 TaxID=3155299 RepID=UPI003437D760